MTVEILLVRHARPEVVPGGDEAADPGLTEEGRRQAELMAKAVGDGLYGDVTAVVTSTMRRARETAEPLTQALGLTAEPDERLVELDHGWTTYGVAADTYPTRASFYEALNAGRWAENRFDPAAFTKRVRAGVDSAVDRHPGGVVAVVCHGGVISAYLATVLGLAEPFVLMPAYCSVSRVLAEPGGRREVLSANESLHMRLG